MGFFDIFKKGKDKPEAAPETTPKKAVPFRNDKKPEHHKEVKESERSGKISAVKKDVKNVEKIVPDAQKKTVETKKEKKIVVDKEDTKDAYKLLNRRIITEKAAMLEQQNQYVFEVSNDANKVEIKKAMQNVYGVTPTAINIVKNLGKKVRFGRFMGKQKRWKKAMVTLPAHQKISESEK